MATIARMVALTRLDCVLGTAALLRQSVAQAIHHARHRGAFGRLLADQPLMRNVLADLALESEAATTLGLRLAGAVDRSEVEFLRIGTALGKYLVCKRGPGVIAEALECLGGNGYVEESVLPRLYREAPVNSVWEGSGNVNALDVLRVLRTSPGAADALLDEVAQARGRGRAARRLRLPARRRRAHHARGAGGGRRVGRSLARRADGARAAGVAAGPARAGRGRGRLLRIPAGRRAGPRAHPRHPARWHGRGRRARPRAVSGVPPANGEDPRDPLGLRSDAPLLDAWLSFTGSAGAGGVRPFTIPGHKQRTDLVGSVVAGDVPLFAGLDTMKLARGVLAQAERKAALFWGADWCRFSVGGSTHGNQTLALALGRPGDEVVVGRTLHRSMLLGLVLAGLRPVWVRPRSTAPSGCPAPYRWRLSSRRSPGTPARWPSSSGTPRTSAPWGTSAASPRPRTRPACRSSSTRHGAATSGCTPRCRRTPSPPARTRW